MPIKFAGLTSGLALLTAVMALTPSARASTTFPDKMASVMPCTPQCTLCHIDNTGGFLRINAFGASMKTIGGLWNTSNTTLFTQDPVAALNRMGTNDTDGDLAVDIDEVHAGTSPSQAGDATICGGGPTYGCGARIAQGTPSDDGRAAAFGILGAALAATVLRRARRSSRGQS